MWSWFSSSQKQEEPAQSVTFTATFDAPLDKLKYTEQAMYNTIMELENRYKGLDAQVSTLWQAGRYVSNTLYGSQDRTQQIKDIQTAVNKIRSEAIDETKIHTAYQRKIKLYTAILIHYLHEVNKSRSSVAEANLFTLLKEVFVIRYPDAKLTIGTAKDYYRFFEYRLAADYKVLACKESEYSIPDIIIHVDSLADPAVYDEMERFYLTPPESEKIAPVPVPTSTCLPPMVGGSPVTLGRYDTRSLSPWCPTSSSPVRSLASSSGRDEPSPSPLPQAVVAQMEQALKESNFYRP